MKIGVSKKCMSTDLPIHLGGFGNPNRKFEGIHDDIHIKALALSGSKTIIIVTADVLGYDKSMLEDVKAKISARTGIPADAMMFNASHTHSAPQVSPNINPLIGAYEEEYGEYFYDSLVKVAVNAYEDLEDGILTFSTEKLVEGIGINRRTIDGGVYKFAPNETEVRNDEVTVLKAKCKNRTKAIIFQYACHPSTIGFNYISADYPGIAASEVEKNHPGTVAMFIQGCCGNIRVRTFLPDYSKFSAGTYDDIDRFGRILSETVESALNKDMTEINDAIETKMASFRIAYQKMLPREEYLKQADASARKEDKDMYMKYYNEYDILPPDVSYSVQRIDLGDSFTFFALEGEVCIEYDYAIKALLPNRHVSVAGYSNGTPGYICTTDMYKYGGYEPVGSCRCYYAREGFDPDTEKVIMEQVKNICK